MKPYNLYQVCFKYVDGATDVPDRAHVIARNMAEVESLCEKHFPTLSIHEIAYMSSSLNSQVFHPNFPAVAG